MIVTNIEFQSVEQWNARYSVDPYAVSRAQQMSAGGLEYYSERINFEGLQLDWDFFGARIRYRELPLSGGIIVGIPLSATGSLKLCGEEVRFGDAYLVPPGGEADFVIAEETEGLWMFLPSEYAEQMCLASGQNMVKRVSKEKLEIFLTTCRDVTCCPKEWRSRVLVALYNLLKPWRAEIADHQSLTTASRHFKLFRQAEEILTATTSSRPININKIAESLGVSRRTLFQAFQSSIGMPPASYQRICRLFALRDRLIAAPASMNTVTELATSSGFNHLGRMYVDYYKHFGETPRTTLLG